MDEIHDMIMQFKTNTDGMDKVMDILDKMNDKINEAMHIANSAANTASCLANGIQPD